MLILADRARPGHRDDRARDRRRGRRDPGAHATAHRSSATPRPTLLFIHGGGWFQGNLDTAEVECGPLATLAGCVVVSVEYRLAPEHPFPSRSTTAPRPTRGCWPTSKSWASIPPGIAIAGTSAGGEPRGGAVACVARDERLPQPLLQLLDVPALDLTLASPSMIEQGSDGGLTRDAVDDLRRLLPRSGRRPHPPARVAAARARPVRPGAGGGHRRRARPGPRRRRALGRRPSTTPTCPPPASGSPRSSTVAGSSRSPSPPVSSPTFAPRALRRAFAGTLVPELPF